MNKSLTLAFEPAVKSPTRPPASALGRGEAMGVATLRVVPAIPYRGNKEPSWLQIKDVADRVIAAAGCADAALLSWHP
jgi:hypothetical protein